MMDRLTGRRLVLQWGMAGLASLAVAAPALAEGAGADEGKLRFIKLPPLLLPGRERYAFIRLVLQLVVRKTEKLPEESALVTAYLPRIIGKLTEELPVDTSLTRNSGPPELEEVKQHVRAMANGIIGQPLIEDVLINSLLTG